MTKYITLVSIPRPRGCELNVELQWLGSSLGLFNMRDKDKTCFRIFVTLLKGSKYRRPFSSDELAAILDISRGTVMHHMNKLMDSGIVVRDRNKYYLRVEKLSGLLNELEEDIQKMFRTMQKIARDIDEHIG